MTALSLTPAPTRAQAPAPAQTSPRTAAIVAGIGYVVLFALAVFANFVVREGLVVAGDAAATAANVTGSEGLFRAGLLSFLVIFLVDVVVAWALHIVFRDQHRDLSLVSAWFRLTYTVFLGIGAIFMFQALQLYSGAEFLTAFDQAQLHAQALISLGLFNSTWLIGLAAFGVHLVLMGWLLIRAPWGPRALGAIMIAAGVAYVTDTVAHAMLPSYDDVAAALTVMVAVPSVIGEGWFGLWLLRRGGRE